MVIAQQGRVFTWGRGNTGQTGLGITDTVTLPTRVEALEGRHVTQVTPKIPSASLSDATLWQTHLAEVSCSVCSTSDSTCTANARTI